MQVLDDSTARIASDGLLGGAYVAIEPAGLEPLAARAGKSRTRRAPWICSLCLKASREGSQDEPRARNRPHDAHSLRRFGVSPPRAAPAFAQRAVIRGLDKVTGQARDYTLTLGRATRIGSLEVVARACTKSAPEETPEVRIYVEVFDNPPGARGSRRAASARRFSMAGCSRPRPGLNAVDHPTYDIWAIDCRD